MGASRNGAPATRDISVSERDVVIARPGSGNSSGQPLWVEVV
jgi:hypothetical protein